MTEHKRARINKRQADFGANLLLGSSITQAAKAAGISRQTAYRWFIEPNFQWRFENTRREVYSHAINKICISQPDSVDALRQLLHSENESIRLRAAQALTRLGEYDKRQLPDRLARLMKEVSELPNGAYSNDDADDSDDHDEEETTDREAAN